MEIAAITQFKIWRGWPLGNLLRNIGFDYFASECTYRSYDRHSLSLRLIFDELIGKWSNNKFSAGRKNTLLNVRHWLLRIRILDDVLSAPSQVQQFTLEHRNYGSWIWIWSLFHIPCVIRVSTANYINIIKIERFWAISAAKIRGFSNIGLWWIRTPIFVKKPIIHCVPIDYVYSWICSFLAFILAERSSL